MNRLTLLILGGIAVGGLILFLAMRYPDALVGQGDQIQLTHALLIVAVIGGAAIMHGRFQLGQAAKYAVAWIAIGGLVVLGYSFRHDVSDLGNRLMGELVPSAAQDGPEGSVIITKGRGGHFVAEARVNGTPIRFLVDTGASDVTLSPRDAERLGFDLNTLAFTRTYQTANGTVLGAPVRLDEVRIGGVAVRDVRASVNGADIGRSLLGMSFLGRLSGFEVSRDRLVMRP